jgi:hypothetical protein
MQFLIVVTVMEIYVPEVAQDIIISKSFNR